MDIHGTLQALPFLTKLIKFFMFLPYTAKYYRFVDTIKFYTKRKILDKNQLKLIYKIPCYSKTFKYSFEKRLQINTHHYQQIQKLFEKNSIENLFKKGIYLLNINIGHGKLTVILKNTGSALEEGPLSLVLRKDEVDLYILSFVFFPISNPISSDAIFALRLQGVKDRYKDISDATIAVGNIEPAVILFKVLESLAKASNINCIFGVSYKNQMVFNPISSNKELFYNNYDAFWMRNNGHLLKDGNYLIHLPLQPKPIEMVKQNHRNRALAKREKLRQLYQISLQEVNTHIVNTNLNCIAS